MTCWQFQTSDWITGIQVAAQPSQAAGLITIEHLLLSPLLSLLP
jgi:hypothetical protein